MVVKELAELLEENGGALGGAQEEHGVDLGDVDALVEEIVALAGLSAGEDEGLAVEGGDRDDHLAAGVGHALGVVDAVARGHGRKLGRIHSLQNAVRRLQQGPAERLPVLDHLRAGALAALDVMPLLKQEVGRFGMGYAAGCSSLMRGVG